MNDFLQSIEAADLVALIGIGFTLVLSAASLYVSIRNSKKTLFINSITSSRIKWISVIRENISEFCGLTFHMAITDLNSEEHQKVLEQIDKLRFLIKLQLNRNDPFDKKIMEKVDQIPHLTEPNKFNQLKSEIDNLILLTQDLLKLEWEGAKTESMKGIIPKSEKKKLYEKYLKTNYALES